MDTEMLLDVLLNTTNEALVITDEKGIICEISRAYTEFLKIKREAAVGKHITKVVDNTRMHIILKTGKTEIEDPQVIRGKTVISMRQPIWRDGKIIGAFGRILFNDINDLNSLYQKLNDVEEELYRYERKFGKINATKYKKEDIIGESLEILALKRFISQVSSSNSNVMITGESGTGKEMVAHAIHNESRISKGPFISVNCGAIPHDLLESEFFGYEEGSFTGAKKGGKKGLFHAANNGTLFLDEIGDLPLGMQVKLLRVIQEKEVRRVGSLAVTPIDVRIISATNKDLIEETKNNLFREDLFYRLNVINISIPPLRMRKTDIPILANFFVNKIVSRNRVPKKVISPGVLEYLKSYDWPGNIRELENIIERAIVLSDTDNIIMTKHLPNKITGNAEKVYKGQSLCKIMEDAERSTIIKVLVRLGGNKSQVAKELGISRTSLYEKIEKYNINLKN